MTAHGYPNQDHRCHLDAHHARDRPRNVALVTDVALALDGEMGVALATVILVRLSVTGHRPFARRELAIS